MQNDQVALILWEIAEHLEINGQNPYRVRAYRRAARSIRKLQANISDLIAQGVDLTNIPAIGKRISAQIKLIDKTGSIPFYLLQKSKEKIFRNELKDVNGLGNKRIQLLNSKLNIYTRQDLISAIERGELRTLKGFNEKLEQKILVSIIHPKPYERFFKLRLASLIIESLIDHLSILPTVDRVVGASDYRRKVEIVGNVNILITKKSSASAKEIIDTFITFDEVKELINVELNTCTVLLQSGMQVTLAVVSNENYGAELINATGSPAHLDALKELAKQKKYIFNEHGLSTNKKLVPCQTEQAFYQQLSLQYISPELRENRGEIAASQKHALPNLITQNAIKGDLHVHTDETDGTEPLIIMVEAAIAKGYDYIAITDHSQRLRITNGLNERRLRQQIDMIDELNSQIKNFTILKSIEVDILEDGSLDLPNSILKELDLCVCSIHSRFNMPQDLQTDRIIRAMDNPYFTILGHATGRLILFRKPYLLDIERIFNAAKERNCFIELNAQPSRLDIKDSYCQTAKAMGVKIAISTDAHSTDEFAYMRFGIDQARRGWLEAKDVINTRTLTDLRKLIKRS